MRTLCLYYSRTELTRKAMERLAELTGADICEYTDGKDRSGVLGYIGACIVSYKKNLPRITIKGDPDLASYDRVIIGMPVWAEKPCAVGRALISQYRGELPEDVRYVITHNAKADYASGISGLDSLLGRPSKGYLSVRTKNNDYLKEIETYAATL